jgi:hypothetical protein
MTSSSITNVDGYVDSSDQFKDISSSPVSIVQGVNVGEREAIDHEIISSSSDGNEPSDARNNLNIGIGCHDVATARILGEQICPTPTKELEFSKVEADAKEVAEDTRIPATDVNEDDDDHTDVSDISGLSDTFPDILVRRVLSKSRQQQLHKQSSLPTVNATSSVASLSQTARVEQQRRLSCSSQGPRQSKLSKPLKSSFSRKYLDSATNIISSTLSAAKSKKKKHNFSGSGRCNSVCNGSFAGVEFKDSITCNSTSTDENKMFLFDFRVSFKSVHVRKYERILGDNPACSSGPSLSLGWNYDENEEVFTVDEWEYNRDDLLYKDLLDLAISPRDRILWLQSLGYSDDEIEQCMKDINLIKLQRTKTAQNNVLQKTEEVLVTAKLRLDKLFRGGKRRNSTSINSMINSSKTGSMVAGTGNQFVKTSKAA